MARGVRRCRPQGAEFNLRCCFVLRQNTSCVDHDDSECAWAARARWFEK